MDSHILQETHLEQRNTPSTKPRHLLTAAAILPKLLPLFFNCCRSEENLSSSWGEAGSNCEEMPLGLVLGTLHCSGCISAAELLEKSSRRKMVRCWTWRWITIMPQFRFRGDMKGRTRTESRIDRMWGPRYADIHSMCARVFRLNRT